MNSSNRWASGPPLSLLPIELLDAIVQGVSCTNLDRENGSTHNTKQTSQLSRKDIVSLAKTSRLMHQRMIPFLYIMLTIYKPTWPYNDIGQLPDLGKFQRTFFQEDGSRETLSILNFVKDLRILPQPWCFLRCSLANHLANRRNASSDEPPDRHARVLEAMSLAAREIFSNVRRGKLGHFAYVFQSIGTNVNE
jgi:hypothetical protein